VTLVAACAAAAIALSMRPEAFSSITPSIVATMVTWAFAVAGSALTPVFVLAIWWRGTTAAGAVAGMATGTALAVAMFVAGTVTDMPLVGEVLVTPTILAAPVAAVVTVLVSRRTRVPDDVEQAWLIMHGTAADRHAERIARLTVAEGRRRGRWRKGWWRRAGR
jgi:cation/acetate symporter